MNIEHLTSTEQRILKLAAKMTVEEQLEQPFKLWMDSDLILDDFMTVLYSLEEAGLIYFYEDAIVTNY